MGIPALIGTGIDLDESVDGKLGIVDGTNGVVYVDPDAELLEEMKKKQQEEQEKKRLLQSIKGQRKYYT